MWIYSHNLPLSTPPSTSLPNPCGYIHTTCLCPLRPQHPFLIHAGIFTQPASVHSTLNIPSWFMWIYSHNLPLSTPPSTSLLIHAGLLHTTCVLFLNLFASLTLCIICLNLFAPLTLCVIFPIIFLIFLLPWHCACTAYVGTCGHSWPRPVPRPLARHGLVLQREQRHCRAT